MMSDPNITACHHNFLSLAGADYTATTVVLTFMPGDGLGTTLDASIPIVDDNLVEGPIQETISVELIAVGSSETGIVRITDNDGKFTHCEPHMLQLMCTAKQVSLSVLIHPKYKDLLDGHVVDYAVGISLYQVHCSKTVHHTLSQSIILRYYTQNGGVVLINSQPPLVSLANLVQ